MDFIKKNPDFTAYRPNVCCIVVNDDARILYCERADIPEAWQLPQGGIDGNEEPAAAAARELYEETGITDTTLLENYPDWLIYPFPNGKKGQQGHIGQAQKFFLFKYNGDPNEVDLHAAPDKEFTTYLWATPEYILQDVVAFRRPLYEECFRHFGLIGR